MITARRLIIIAAGLIGLWQLVVLATKAPPYILPGPWPVLQAAIANGSTLLHHLQTTGIEMVAGLLVGTLLGTSCALVMIIAPLLRRWLLPVLVISQAVPVFALAPLLVLWLGYGMASKIAMAVLIIFFPVASSFYQGMRRTNRDLLELARIMGARPVNVLRFIVIPAALPAFASGLRVATAVAPIGAVVGEWVGSSAGLGFYMLHANARMQVDVMFAALALLSAVSLVLYFSVDYLLDKLIYWQPTQGVTHE
ncbi:ABC transporter permease [Desulfofustis glycolicus]|uniref:Putative hydroxymethylpyrimidine transport system permease protein n=1 Tax=Desulfofustis glycolicus DSM 9705 TaxID=1121409 RepID=A0A1M5XFA0_9BACT|nr:ABC transporter permease [Desulfofustis glycolicus]MCB2218540.1 ABC transporter permease [Desulfobulbaceae bacterium]SHH98184.1 putative hydroxymethylpyrimidine transport system permease protein [Desulfofustis glycolicus DSM 9705]